MKRWTGLAWGGLFVLVYSWLPVAFYLVKETHAIDVPWMMALMHVGALAGAIAIAVGKRQKPPTLSQWRPLVGLALSGCAAAAYFIAVLEFQPAIAEWQEQTFLPVFVIILGVAFENNRPSTKGWTGTAIALLGYAIFIIPAVDEGSRSLGIACGVLGAAGSAMNVFLMSRLVRQGAGRFYAIAVRYGLVSVLMMAIALIYGEAHTVTLSSAIAALAIGIVIIDLSLYIALEVIIKCDLISFALFLLLVPVFTTAWQLWTIGLRSPPTFFAGVFVILLGLIIKEFNLPIVKGGRDGSGK